MSFKLHWSLKKGKPSAGGSFSLWTAVLCDISDTAWASSAAEEKRRVCLFFPFVLAAFRKFHLCLFPLRVPLFPAPSWGLLLQVQWLWVWGMWEPPVMESRALLRRKETSESALLLLLRAPSPFPAHLSPRIDWATQRGSEVCLVNFRNYSTHHTQGLFLPALCHLHPTLCSWSSDVCGWMRRVE